MSKLLIGMSAYNEIHRIGPVIEELRQNENACGYGVVVGDDGSSDGTKEYLGQKADEYGWGFINQIKNRGIGAMIRAIIAYGRENGYEALVIISANGKTDINSLHKLYDPVLSGDYDYVKGSRYMKGGKHENMPFFRLAAIPMYSAFVSLLMGKGITDATFTVNASRLSIYGDPDMNLEQEWLERYGLEYYIMFYAIKKYRVKEVPMNVRYPDDKLSYSKIKPFFGWWDMIRPWIMLKLGIKK